MLVIQYNDTVFPGGLGDRIVGMISVKTICNILNRPFKINWIKENVKKYIDYSKYDYELYSNKSDDIKIIVSHEQKKLKSYLSEEQNIFPHTETHFYINQEISQYLFMNNLYKNNNYYKSIYNEYNNLFNDILKPTNYLLDNINKHIYNKKNIIGLQYRCGDKYMLTNGGEQHDTNYVEYINSSLQKIKDICDNKYENYNIFITSDYSDIYIKTVNVFNKENVIYVDDIIQHIDRKSVDDDISKVFIDMYILSQKTTELYISICSNYGRVAALSSPHNNIYDVINLQKLDKKNLLSKEENYYSLNKKYNETREHIIEINNDDIQFYYGIDNSNSHNVTQYIMCYLKKNEIIDTKKSIHEIIPDMYPCMYKKLFIFNNHNLIHTINEEHTYLKENLLLKNNKIYIEKSIDNLTTYHNAGFFSCCSVKLMNIIQYYNKYGKIPDIVDSQYQFNWYKKDLSQDITFEYFENYNKNDIVFYKDYVDYLEGYQFSEYSKLDYENICPFIDKYFSVSRNINYIINTMENKYNLNYENTCVLFYRGNDKNRETHICSYIEYVIYAKNIMDKNPNIQFLIQSDETEFIEIMGKLFPNSFYFKDETRHMKKCDDTVDIVMRETNNLYSKYYLAITLIMSKCKYVVCGSGNCSIWIMLYRGNCKNIYQNFNNKWYIT